VLLLSRQWFADAGLAFLLGIVLLNPPTDRRHADIHCLADVRDTEALFCNHTDDLELEAGVKIAALPGDVNSIEGELSTYRGVRGH
jgi:hypothetical protein